MAKFKGREFLIKRGNGATPTEVFTTVAGMRSTSLSLNSETVDVTDKSGAPWRELLADAGIRSMSVSLAGVFTGAAVLAEMMQSCMAGTISNYQLVSGSGDSFSGAFQITSIERAGEHGGEETYSMSLESSGEVTYTPAA